MKMCPIKQETPSSKENKSVKRKAVSGSPVPTKKVKKESAKIVSSNMKDCIKTFCCICDQIVNVSGLKKHTKSRHQVHIEEYRKRFGNPISQLLRRVVHPCTICKRELLLDYDTLVSHLFKQHKVNMKEYSEKHLTGKNERHASTSISPPPQQTSSFSKANSSLFAKYNISSSIISSTSSRPLSYSPPRINDSSKINTVSPPGPKRTPPGPKTNTSSTPGPKTQSPPGPKINTSSSTPSGPKANGLTTPGPKSQTNISSPLRTNVILPSNNNSSLSSTNPSSPVSKEDPLSTPEAPKVDSLVTIKCDTCQRIFRKNIELKVHKRREGH